MRSSVRLLARYLEAGAPTGLTGIRTHPTPRMALLATYLETLEALQAIPESSLYRQSVESVTKHRLGLVENMSPPGFDAWKSKVNGIRQKHALVKFKFPEPELDLRSTELEWDGDRGVERAPIREAWDAPPPKYQQANDKLPSDLAGQAPEAQNVVQQNETELNEPKLQEAKLDEIRKEIQELAGNGKEPDTETLAGYMVLKNQAEETPDDVFAEVVDIERPPDLTAEQVAELEQKIGGGLIEEVLKVAEGELDLVKTMAENKVWEPLVEEPAEGQWTYFERRK